MVNTRGNLDEDPEVYLIDFGFSDKYVYCPDNEHISESETVDFFQGNMLFASVHQMDFKKTSRKDDLISLFYLLIYMLNNQSLWVGSNGP